jgi:hypothetical protein
VNIISLSQEVRGIFAIKAVVEMQNNLPICAFLPFWFVDVIVITVHDHFWNVGQANCILKYFENIMIGHSDSTIF